MFLAISLELAIIVGRSSLLPHQEKEIKAKMTIFLLCILSEMWYKVPGSTKVRQCERISVTRAKPSSYHLRSLVVDRHDSSTIRQKAQECK